VKIAAGTALAGTITNLRGPSELNVRFSRLVVGGGLYFVSGGVTQVMDAQGAAISGVTVSGFAELQSAAGRLELAKGTIFRVRLR